MVNKDYRYIILQYTAPVIQTDDMKIVNNKHFTKGNKVTTRWRTRTTRGPSEDCVNRHDAHATTLITADAGYHWLQEIVGNFEEPKELHHTIVTMII